VQRPWYGCRASQQVNILTSPSAQVAVMRRMVERVPFPPALPPLPPCLPVEAYTPGRVAMPVMEISTSLVVMGEASATMSRD
jgi:hypothetical protein